MLTASPRRLAAGFVALVAILFVAPSRMTAEEPAAAPARGELNAAVQQAFVATHEGWSADEVILDDELNARFIAECQKLLPEADPAACNWALLTLRKSGRLDVKATRRRRSANDGYEYAAEIAARFLYDKYELSIDRVMCDPKLRAEYDRVAQTAAPGVSTYLLRKTAYGLRKARQLEPELVARVADWGREVTSHPAEELVKQPDLVPQRPGVYIFRDTTGYLYIGESSELRSRITKHLDHSDRKSLAHYFWEQGIKNVTVELHAFDPDSDAKNKTSRRAYESDLIRSRKPRFNIAP